MIQYNRSRLPSEIGGRNVRPHFLGIAGTVPLDVVHMQVQQMPNAEALLQHGKRLLAH